MGKLNDKVAIITGATSGMGRGIAIRFAAEGAQVIASGRDSVRGGALVQEIAAFGGNARFVPGDISTASANQRLVEAALSAYGGLDILVMSAGELGLGSITDTPIDLWDRTIATNLSAVYYLLHYGISEMRKRGRGSAVVIGSIAGYKVFPNHAAYCASKGALIQLVRQAALDYGPDIRINAIHPGQVDTPLLWDSVRAFPNPGEIVQQTADRLPMKRLGQPEDIAAAALFLAGDDAAWITGANLVVDGGSLCLA